MFIASARYRAVHLNTCLLRPSSSIRSLSSIPPHKDTSSKPTESIPPPNPPHKLKLNLRPAPVKPTQTLSKRPNTTPLPTRLHNTTTHLSRNQQAVIETAQQDLTNTEHHGILKQPPPDVGLFKRALHKLIELFKFYFRGVKMIFAHRKQVAEIRRRVRTGGAPMTRSEFRFIETYKQDIRKLIPFILIVLVVEEIIPLIAIYAPFMLPSTCILPSQQARIQEQKTTKAVSFASLYSDMVKELVQDAKGGQLPLSSLRVPEGPTVVCGLLRLSTVGPDFLRIRRIKHHMQFIFHDDRLLAQASHGASLSADELSSALEERGIITTSLSHEQQRQQLRQWLWAADTLDDKNAVSSRIFLTLQGIASVS